MSHSADHQISTSTNNIIIEFPWKYSVKSSLKTTKNLKVKTLTSLANNTEGIMTINLK